MVFAVPVVLGKDPRSNYLIKRPEETMRRHGYRDVGPKDTRLLALPHHVLNKVKVLNHQIVGELAQEFETVPELGLKHDGQIAVVPQPVQVEEGDATQLFPGLRDLGDRGSGPLDKTVEGGV